MTWIKHIRSRCEGEAAHGRCKILVGHDEGTPALCYKHRK